MTDQAPDLDFDAAVASLSEEIGTPEVAPGVPTIPDGAPPKEPEPVELPGFEALEAKAKERAAERAKREEYEAPIRALEERIAALPSGPALSIAELQRDPIAALKAAGVDTSALQKALTKQALAPDPTDSFRALLREELAALKPKEAERPANTGPTAEEAMVVFADGVMGAPDRFPTLARLSQKMQGQVAYDYVMQMRDAGYDTSRYTDEQIAMAIERQLSPGTPPPANGQPKPPGAPTTAHGGPPSSATSSITNGLAADGQRQPPQTDEEREAAAVAWLENQLRA